MGRWGLGRGLRLRDRRCRPTPGRGVSCEKRKIWGGWKGEEVRLFDGGRTRMRFGSSLLLGLGGGGRGGLGGWFSFLVAVVVVVVLVAVVLAVVVLVVVW